MLTLLCTAFMVNLSSVSLASEELETETKVLVDKKEFYETKQMNKLHFDTLNYAKQRSFYFYDMIPDYFEVQSFLRDIYGDTFIDNSYQYKFLTQSKENFDKYYRTNDINDLDLAMTYLYDHHASVGNYESYHVNYKITSNQKRAYVPSNFTKDRSDITEFMLYVMNLAYP